MIVSLVMVLLSAAPAADRQFRCEALEGLRAPRHFAFSFAENGKSLSRVKVVETDRIFTPGNVVATFSTRTGVTNIPTQRPGSWAGVIEGDARRFTLKARDGSASFAITPDAATPGKFALSWDATLSGPQFGEQSASGTGTCTEITADTKQ